MEVSVELQVSCGPLLFGAKHASVAAILGPPKRNYATGRSGMLEVREGSPFVECGFDDGQLVQVTLDHTRISRVTVLEVELLHTPLDEVLTGLDAINAGTGQAQGGSLYYEGLGIALLQFEDVGAREVSVFMPDPETQDPLKPISAEDAIAYYRAQTGRDPASDWFGRLPGRG